MKNKWGGGRLEMLNMESGGGMKKKRLVLVGGLRKINILGVSHPPRPLP